MTLTSSIPGIRSKLDYIASLGFDIFWIYPRYYSPQIDMGYDISDYESIYPPYGTVAGAERLISAQHEILPRPEIEYDADGKRHLLNNWRNSFGGASAWVCHPHTEHYLPVITRAYLWLWDGAAPGGGFSYTVGSGQPPADSWMATHPHAGEINGAWQLGGDCSVLESWPKLLRIRKEKSSILAREELSLLRAKDVELFVFVKDDRRGGIMLMVNFTAMKQQRAMPAASEPGLLSQDKTVRKLVVSLMILRLSMSWLRTRDGYMIFLWHKFGKGNVESGIDRIRRKRRLTGGQGHPRKRAAIACDYCRSRKTRCDNARPSCGPCCQAEIVCSYSDAASNIELVQHPSTSELLERINYAVDLIENKTGLLGSCFASPISSENGNIVRTTPLPIGERCTDQARHESTASVTLGSPSSNIFTEDVDSFRSPAGSLASESILRWPVLLGYLTKSNSSFLWEPEPRDTVSRMASGETPSHDTSRLQTVLEGSKVSQSHAIIDESRVVELVDKYLAFTHSKNPILDGSKLRQYAAEVEEFGCSWNGRSCLVLLACAIASITTLFYPTEALLEGSSPKSSVSPESALGDTFFKAAKKRLSVLELGLTCAQGQYMAGIYEMNRMRALAAWSHYQQAGVNLQIVLWRQAQMASRDDNAEVNGDRKLIERLYFSYVRTESELRAEIPLPECGITMCNPPSMFPSPPLSAALPIRIANMKGPDPETEETQSWLYYLSEISVLRSYTRMLRVLYSNVGSWWIRNIELVTNVALEFESEIHKW
ncbi:uncharacterized protein N7498_009895 [Penicillium cinerascens]|uniref:Zn(2)-C6 fungal-type domain-containing protein n=1 Tax=Penicillium cinerascens TaxID=70096 RepID=A0A9W9J5W1_9EURO|nr:uncharacterized protein N7498_009895 [Penicillium cinerascens]KAJ5190910.1 hypothetical protein N7498_009895 [Penicillium cinerascens]